MRLGPKQLSRLVEKLVASSWPAQLEIVRYRGERRRMALHGTRRTAKTTGIAIRFLLRALTEPGYKALFISLTYKNVHRDFYQSTLRKLLTDAGYDVSSMPANLPWTLPNGSVIDGFACDSNEDASKRIRGSHWDDVAIDEAGHWRIDIKEMIDGPLRMALVDKLGCLFLMGTPGDIPNTFWHRVCTEGTPEHYAFDVLRLHWSDNPYMREQVESEITNIQKYDPEYLKTPKFRREVEGEWVVDDEDKVYRVHYLARLEDHLVDPPGKKEDYHWSLGVDDGFTDEFAISVMCWPKRGRKVLRIVDVFKQSGLDMISKLEKLCAMVEEYRPVEVTVDCSAPDVIKTLNDRFLINARKSASRGKKEHVDLLNADMRRGDVLLLKRAAAVLLPEWDELVWDKRVLQESFRWETRGVDHASDATLYGYWNSRHYWVQPHERAKPYDPFDWSAREREIEERYAQPKDPLASIRSRMLTGKRNDEW